MALLLGEGKLLMEAMESGNALIHNGKDQTKTT